MSRTRLLCAAGRTSVPAGPYCDAVQPSRWGHTHPAICFPTCHPTTTAARPCPLWPPPDWTGTAPRTGCPASCGPVAVSCTPSAEADVLRRHGFRRTCHAMTIVAWANPAQHGQPRQEALPAQHVQHSPWPWLWQRPQGWQTRRRPCQMAARQR